MVSPLANALQFLEDFGFFDVVLPFLFVFTLVFAILEKTKLFGVEGEDKVSKKNINAMISFTISLFATISIRFVSIIREAIPLFILILVLLFAFLLLVGSMFGSEEFNWKDSGWAKFLTFVIFVVIVLIFMYVVGWLQPILDYVSIRWEGTLVTSIILLLIVVGAVFWVMGGGGKGGKKKGD